MFCYVSLFIEDVYKRVRGFLQYYIAESADKGERDHVKDAAFCIYSSPDVGFRIQAKRLSMIYGL